jgi:hypothetical protein
MSGFQITCANKNTSGVIVRVGGPGWSLDMHEAIKGLVTGQLRLNIRIGDTQHDVGVRGDGMDAYLVLEPDGTPLHEIDGLSDC